MIPYEKTVDAGALKLGAVSNGAWLPAWTGHKSSAVQAIARLFSARCVLRMPSFVIWHSFNWLVGAFTTMGSVTGSAWTTSQSNRSAFNKATMPPRSEPRSLKKRRESHPRQAISNR